MLCPYSDEKETDCRTAHIFTHVYAESQVLFCEAASSAVPPQKKQ
jgi:hypothetical protein